MADRTFTEGEHYALVEDAVKRETAAAATKVSELETKVTELQNAHDVLVTEKAAETQRADQAAQALIDYKDEIEQERAREARRTERLAQVAEAAPLLEITDDRSNRIVAMSDEVFESYLSDLREVSAKAPKPFEKDEEKDKEKKDKEKASELPRESAAFSGTTTDKPQGTVMGLFGASRDLRTA